MIYLSFTLLILGCFAIGGWLIREGHPWFALLIIIIGASVSMSQDRKFHEPHDPNNHEQDQEKKTSEG